MTAVEALAASWASIDGHLEAFNEGRGKSVFDDRTGHYAGYMEEARELLERLKARGFWLAPMEATEEMLDAGQIDSGGYAALVNAFLKAGE